MKKILLCTMICSSFSLIQAQELNVKMNSSVSLESLATSSETKKVTTNTEKSTVCTDLVRYGDKGTAQAGGDVGETFWAAVQVFPNFTGSITGGTFNGNSVSGNLNAADSFAIVIYDIYYESFFDAYCPTGAPLGGAYFSSIATAANDYTVTFASPVTITNPDGFAIALACYGDGDSVNINMSPDNTGDGGHFSFVLGGGSIYSQYLAGYDTDFMIYPKISFMQPTIGLNVNTNSICEDATVNFTNTPAVTIPTWYSDVYGFASFNLIEMYNTSINDNQLWSYDYGDGSPLSYSNTQSGSNHMYTSLGSYDAELALNYYGYTNNCKSISTETIVVNGPPTGTGFTWQSTGLSVEFNEMTDNATTYSWNFGDFGSSGAPNPIHNYTASGTYTVELTATNSCGSSLFYLNIDITDTTNSGNVGINETAFDKILALYPNPSTGIFNVDVSESGMNLIIVDIIGKAVLTKNLIKGENMVDLSKEAKGVYVASFTNETGVVRTERIVIE